MKVICAVLCVLLATQAVSSISQANFYHESAKNGYKQMIEFQSGASNELDMSLDYHFFDLELSSETEFKNWVIQEAQQMRTLMTSLKPKGLKHDLYSKVEVSVQDIIRVRDAVQKAQGKISFKSLKLSALPQILTSLVASSGPKTVIIVTKKLKSTPLSHNTVSSADQSGELSVQDSEKTSGPGEFAQEHLEHPDFHRVMQGSNTTVKNGTTPSKVYVKPDALFGILLSIFIFVITYIAVMCLYDVKTPRNFAQKQLKYGKEM